MTLTIFNNMFKNIQQNIDNELCVITLIIIPEGPFTPLKKDFHVCLMRIWLLVDLLWLLWPVLLICLQICLLSTFSFHLYFYMFQWQYALLSNDLFWLPIGFSLLDSSLLMWLFPTSVVLRVPIYFFLTLFYIVIWLLFVLACVSNPSLAACSLRLTIGSGQTCTCLPIHWASIRFITVTLDCIPFVIQVMSFCILIESHVI